MLIGESERSSRRTTLRGELQVQRSEPMQTRLDVEKIAPNAMKIMRRLEEYVRNSGLEPALLELIRTRASQINGCAYCLHMHAHDARVRGETETRLYLLNAWRESPLYNDRERAALAWTEAVTLISQTHAPDETYDEARRHFFRSGTGQFDGRGRGDQCMESARDQLPKISAGVIVRSALAHVPAKWAPVRR